LLSAFMSFEAPAFSSELMLFERSPFILVILGGFFAPRRLHVVLRPLVLGTVPIHVLDWADFAPRPARRSAKHHGSLALPRKPRSDGGALCWWCAPDDGASRLMVPCALAKPVPAIKRCRCD